MTDTTDYRRLIEDQAARSAQALSRFVRTGQDFALVDFPDHYNVGDSAIWLGEIALFKRLLGGAPSYVSTVESYSKEALRRAAPTGPIFIHGGGNFGDIYPKHQDFRIRLMTDFPDRDIVQLPQSISFSAPEAVAATAQAIAKHGRFTLLVRDQPSLNFAREHFVCPVELLPDMAFGIGPIEKPVSPSSAIFMLLREDTERAAYDREPLLRRPDAVAADWVTEPQRFHRLCTWRSRIAMAGKGGLASPQGTLDLYNRLAQGRVKRGLKMLASGRVVVTDRLHAHILSTMMDIPHVVLDNSYGKIAGYMAAWTGVYPKVRRARTSDDVLAHLKEWGL